ncbi:MAG: F-type H+-transporting ATPase subunit epsilon [Patescibacteria group bacterium]|nr:F-type H+-transporting ATPase subunit epsilon [Patescibacteria group bacterium]
MKDKPKLKVKVIEAKKTLFYGKAYSISSTNDRGPFDILPGHSSFITLIDKYISIVQEDGETLNFDLTNGVLRNKKNYVKVYLGTNDVEIV